MPEQAPAYSDPRAFDPPPETSWGKLLRLVPEGSRVLDVGCSFGGFSSALRRLRKCYVVGIEIDPAAARVARENCDELFEGDLIEIHAQLPGNFDVVVAADVLEHLVEPGAALGVLRSQLKPSGLLLASIPNVTHLSVVLALAEGRFPRSREGLLDQTHLRFFGEADVLDLFHEADYAARIADSVRIDPRLTEFHTDLLSLPPPVLDYLGRNPGSDAYQFIVRAVPREWAVDADDQSVAAERTAGEGPAASLRAQLDELHARLREYHLGLTSTSQQLERVTREVGVQQEELQRERTQLDSARAEAGAAAERALGLERTVGETSVRLGHVEDLREMADSKRWAQRVRPLGPIPPTEASQLRVLFVANRDDNSASFRYRCVQACEQLREAGVVANIARLAEPGLAETVRGYSLVVFFRLGWSDEVALLMEAARRSGAAVAFDVDDLIFDPQVERWMTFLRRFPPHRVAEYRRDFASLAETLRRVDFCIAATPTIARHARSFGARAVVHPNLLPRAYVRLSRTLARLRPGLLREPLIGYLSGSNTHDGDLESIAGALGKVLHQRPDARLALCGHAKLPSALVEHHDRILRLPYQDFRVYPWLIARCAAVVAPIEEVNEFSNGKSALKVFEAAAFGVPAVATPTVQYQEAIQNGVTGYLASSEREWETALLKLCDRDVSLSMGAGARRLALEEYSPDAYAHALARQLLGLAGKSSGELPALAALSRESKLKAALRVARSSIQLAVSRDPGAHAGNESPIERHSDLNEAQRTAAWVGVAQRQGAALTVSGARLGIVLSDRAHPPAASSATSLRALEGLSPGCRFAATSGDPSFVLDLPEPLHAPPTAVLVELRAHTSSGSAAGQVFWKAAGEAFKEGNSVRFPVAADGEVRPYLLYLGGVPGSITGLRFDPIDCAGEVEVTLLALLERLPPAGTPSVRLELANRFLKGDGIEIGALHNPLQVPEAARVRYVDRLSIADLRKHYPELAALNVVDPSIIASGENLEPVATGSQNFVVCNHVLEHMRDPLRALDEWVRVLAPGGVLYVSIPNRNNPHDRLRPVTSLEHILEDHQEQGRKGSDADHASFFEWSHSAHAHDMGPDDRDRHARDLIAQDYSIHFHVFDRMLFERVLGRACAAGGASVVDLRESELDGYSEFIAIVRRDGGRPGRGVDVVVPVYNAREFTSRCVESALRHGTGDVRFVLINDKSTDPAIEDDLRAFARRDGRVIVLSNESNLGFVGTANRGMKHAAGRDVLLLNSDTEVAAGYLDQLRDAAYASADTGIVTPFSNNATIFSIPEFGDNPLPAGHTAESLARVVTAVSRRLRPEMPTGVGFCMYTRAEVFEKVGYFDEQTFGRGFGEENDLCQRARKAGIKVRLCDDAFVWHKGKASFGQAGRELELKNEVLLRQKHPEYGPAVVHFFRTNPLSELHRELKLHIPRLREGARGAALFMVHSSPFASAPGGTEHHVRDLIRALALPRAVLAWPDQDALVAAEILDGRVDSPLLFRFALSRPAERFAIDDDEIQSIVRHWVNLFGLRWAHLHHLMFWPIAVARTLHEAGVPFVFTAHDYYSVCPNWNLFDFAKAERCPCAADGSGCLPAFFEASRLTSPPALELSTLRARHRAAWLGVVGAARAVVAPSGAAAAIVQRHLGVPVQILEHGYDAAATATRPSPGPLLRLGVLGEIAYPLKGARQYLKLMELARDLPVEWHVFGNAERFEYAAELRALGLGPRLVLHGPYDRAQIVRLLIETGIDLCVLLPEWDETFSYTLSEAQLAGAPTIVSDRGALAERVRRDGGGIVVGSAQEAFRELERLCHDRAALRELTARVAAIHHRTLQENIEAHRALYEQLGFSRTLDAELRPEWLHELTERISPPRTLPPPPPADPEWRTRLQPMIDLARPWVPKPARALGKAVLRRLISRPLLALHPAKKGTPTGLRLVKHKSSAATYEAQNTDPQLLFAVQVPSASVSEFRFRMRRAANGVAHAQLFWATTDQTSFSEDRSTLVQLDGPGGEWREYRVRLDAPGLAEHWRCGTIAHLRFDPTDQPGVIELGPLEFLG
jgi:GT2 family glycosyltransferase/2-polyprenyl-3-methyl-5-hydroxy-6-metoxy-1,4-benzoquinol methylase